MPRSHEQNTTNIPITAKHAAAATKRKENERSYCKFLAAPLLAEDARTRRRPDQAYPRPEAKGEVKPEPKPVRSAARHRGAQSTISNHARRRGKSAPTTVAGPATPELAGEPPDPAVEQPDLDEEGHHATTDSRPRAPATGSGTKLAEKEGPAVAERALPAGDHQRRRGGGEDVRRRERWSAGRRPSRP